jgi:hypothetical protein
MILEPPKMTPNLSIALALPYYHGENNFSYSPALYYNLVGEENSDNPFGNSGRLRIEAWVYFYPSKPTNFRIGITPYFSYRTHGTDDFDQFLFGAILQVRIETTLLKFL